MSDETITERLDTIISLLLPKFDERNYEFKGIKLDILRLCDYTNTVAEMMSKLKKPRQRIDDALSALRKDGYIRTIKKEENTVYIRLK